MKIAASTLALLAAGSLMIASAFAGAAEPAATNLKPGPPPLERFIKPLGITPSQQAKLKPIFAEAQAQAATDVKEASTDGKKPNPAEMAKTQSMRQADLRLRLATVLTPEQLTGYEQLTASSTPREQTAEMHSAHGHRDVDTPATARDAESQRP
jgi:hypothetical protein